jgi:hypothetical protein
MQNRLLNIALVVLATSCYTACMIESVTETEPARAVPSRGLASVRSFPFQEAWYGMYFREDKVGYSHFKIQPAGKNFVINTDSLMRLTAMKKTSEVSMEERTEVRPDLTLLSFQSRVSMNGQKMTVVGKTDAKRLYVDITVDKEKLRKEFPFEGKIYHCSAVSFMPILRGLKDGRTDSFRIFDPQKLGFEQIDQTLSTVKGEAGPSGAVWKVRNQYGQAQVVAWLNNKGLTVVEKSLEGSMLTVLEDEASAKDFLKKKTASKDLVLDVSLIKVAKVISSHEKLRFLKVGMHGIDRSVIAEDRRQRISNSAKNSRSKDFEVSVHVETPAAVEAAGETLPPAERKKYLASTVAIQTGHKEIAAQAQKIVSPHDSDLKKVTELVNWTADTIKNEVRDSLTAVSVLRTKEGECQAHAILYAAMARSLGIPTRVVTGIVYTKDTGGFLYHAWAESFIGGWLAVDPTFKQVPADATHISLATDDSHDVSPSIHKMLGKVRMEVLDYK